MCSTGPFQYRWLKGYIYSSCYYHHQFGSIHLPHCYHIFPWLCAWDVCYIILCHLLHIRSGKTGNLLSLLLCSLWWVHMIMRWCTVQTNEYDLQAKTYPNIQYSDTFWLADRTRLFVQYTISLFNIRICFGLQIVLVCLYSAPSHYHHCVNLSEGIELKCLSDIFCRVCE